MAATSTSSALRCKACGSVLIKRSHRSGFREKVLSIAGSYPYKCHDCQARFFLTVPNIESDAPVTQKRRERIKNDKKRKLRLVLLFVVSLGIFALIAYLVIFTPPASQ